MRKLKMSEATASLAEYTRDLKQGPLVVTVNGKPVAALVPIEGMDWESLCVGTSPIFLDIIERSRRRFEAEGGIPSKELRLDFAKDSKRMQKTKANGRKAKIGKRAGRYGGKV